ncbi:MAG: hypothetical protein M5U34_21440 [Chloroflexi bacterium]|nr:hypothetical protein [Chloroflexota bacterium]
MSNADADHVAVWRLHAAAGRPDFAPVGADFCRRFHPLIERQRNNVFASLPLSIQAMISARCSSLS